MRSIRSTAAAACLALAATGLGALTGTGAQAAPAGNGYFLNNTNTGGVADIRFTFARSDDQILVGDWDGNTTDTLAVRRGSRYYLKSTNESGPAQREFSYGGPGDVVLSGDWDGNGTDTLAVRRGSRYFLSNSNTGGIADLEFSYGGPGDVVLAGDWDGNGTDTLAVRRGSRYYLNNSNSGGVADVELSYGGPGDVVLVGDWDGDGTDTLAVRRGSRYFLNNSNTGGVADVEFSYGRRSDVVLVGDWDGNSTDTLGVRRPSPTAPPTDLQRGDRVRAEVVLDELAVVLENGAGYDRDLFRHWTDADGDSCDTREEVLIAESTVTPQFGSGCQVTSGRWVSWYDNAVWANPSDVDIDHMVALAEAWSSGARAWTGGQREAFANDLGHPWSLDAVTDNVNASKGARDPAEWLPPSAATHCTYAIHWVTVKYRWRLSIDPAEENALESLLSGSCGDRQVTVPARGL